MSTARRERRQRTLLPGQIVFNEGVSTIDCVIRNLSESGAQLRLPSSIGVPDHFDLLIPRDGRRLSATLAWRDGRSIGVSFDVAERLDADAGQLSEAG